MVQYIYAQPVNQNNELKAAESFKILIVYVLSTMTTFSHGDLYQS